MRKTTLFNSSSKLLVCVKLILNLRRKHSIKIVTILYVTIVFYNFILLTRNYVVSIYSKDCRYLGIKKKIVLTEEGNLE